LSYSDTIFITIFVRIGQLFQSLKSRKDRQMQGHVFFISLAKNVKLKGVAFIWDFFLRSSQFHVCTADKNVLSAVCTLQLRRSIGNKRVSA